MVLLKYICFAVTFLLVSIDCSKILFLMPAAGRSHKNVFDALMAELLTRDHDITIVSPYPSNNNATNYHEIIIDTNILQDPTKVTELFDMMNVHPVIQFYHYLPYFMPFCEKFFETPKVKALIKAGQQFDTVIVNGFMNEFALSVAPLLGKTIIWLTPCTLMPWTRFFVPAPPSYVPNMMLPYTAKMNFFQRLNNVFTNVGQQMIMDYYLVPSFERVVFKHVPKAIPYNEALKKVDFVLTNVDPVLSSPRPTMPNIVNAGGMHCKEGKKLPKEFEDFINTSGNDGFILFSLGSNAQSRYLPPEKKEAFITALSKLNQKVIWKYEEQIDNLPANIKITSWMPQQDILAHPKCKLFITHGGRLSLQEAVYHGVPVAAIPLFGDQPSNVARVKELEIGDHIDLTTVTASGVYETVHKLLTDKKYSENMKKYSAINRDEPQRPEKRAAFWVEYVIRHDGAKHFRSAGERLNFFQYFLLDVIALLLSVIGVIFFLCYKTSKFILSKICPSKKAVGKHDQAKKNK